MTNNGINFRVAKVTFTFPWDKIRGDISRQNTMRKAVPPESRLADTLYYLIASTEEYRAVANHFGVSASFAMHMN